MGRVADEIQRDDSTVGDKCSLDDIRFVGLQLDINCGTSLKRQDARFANTDSTIGFRDSDVAVQAKPNPSA